MKKKSIMFILTAILVFAFSSFASAASLSVTSSSVEEGQNVTVQYSGGSGLSGSWIGLYKVGSVDRSYSSYQYINTNTSGTLTFKTPYDPGSYEFRIFKDRGYTRIGLGGSFTVVKHNPKLTATPSTVRIGEKVRVTYSGASGVAGSWIGLYKVGSSDRSFSSFQYINTNTSGYLDFTVPNQEGNYEFRIFRGGAYTKIGTGGNFTVSSAAQGQVLRGTGLLDGIKLDWDRSTQSGVVGYNLYRGTSSGNYSSTPVTDFYIRELTYTDNTVLPDRTYYYIMKPVFSNGTEGAASNEVAVRRSATPAVENRLTLQINNPYMTVRGVRQEIDPGRGTAPVIVNGRTLLPIRAVVESMGGTIAWDGVARKVTIREGSKTVELWINSRTAYVNGVAKELDVPAQIINDRTMVPFRFVGEALGKDIGWDGATRTVTMKLN